MKKYNVTIKATVTKTYEVEAETEDQAREEAHGIFSVISEDGIPENYEEDTLSVEEVTT